MPEVHIPVVRVQGGYLECGLDEEPCEAWAGCKPWASKYVGHFNSG